ncbi:cobyrinic acid a,c-diamide synthase (plasmid) [Halostagnicola larsenii XH-48]|uniref:Cobyrinic acid a,c-diamide synthase n=2 Tax=Halostagnicola larsenii TaxID=353800 RepID=W0JV32_9EURY|nr:cobyrinic acid a,c-diamide synthase [Halostagnicola larsenii XH-48]
METANEVLTNMSDQRAVSVALQKGGVGKTTVAINLAERLANRSNDVLLVDLDQQGNATEGVGLADAYQNDVHIGHVLEDSSETTLGDVIREAGSFDVLPANEDLDSVENSIRSATFGELWIRNEIIDPVLEDTYDYVVVDSPPNLGPLADASLISTQNVIVPLRMSEPSVSGFERMYTQQITPIRKEIDLDIMAIVPNALSGDNEEKRIIGNLEESEFGKYLPEFARTDHFDDPDSPGPGIRERIAFRRAWREGVPLAEYDPESDMLERLDALAAVVERGGVLGA